MSDNSVFITQALDEDFHAIKHFVKLFELDDREMFVAQFLVAKNQEDLVGFGRIRKHAGCDEFCTLGVVQQWRKAGAGKKLIKAIVEISTQPLYLACVIPAYFEPYGFKVVGEYPLEMAEKLLYCNVNLPVEEKYVVMQYLP